MNIGMILTDLDRIADARTHLQVAPGLWDGLDERKADKTRGLLTALDERAL